MDIIHRLHPATMDKSRSSSPASSPLSMADSESFEADYFQQEMAQPPLAKRQKLDDGSVHATPASHDVEFDALSSISSDTSGDIPQSPSVARAFDEEDVHEQVTTCAWEGCKAGDLGNMDRLVEHIHNDHIEGRHKKYTCEWEDCSRKSMPHASGYALRAHVRSHTREKPFYCALPECDRSFTRSDALAKHMRTVHETEALRPSDPIPKSMQPLIKSGTRLKLIIKQPQGNSDGQGQSPGSRRDQTSYPEFPNLSTSSEIENLTPFSNELGFTSDELSRGSRELWRLLRRQVHWAKEESDALLRECEIVEAMREKEWVEKEILLDQVIKNEIDWHKRREMVLATLPSADELRARALAQVEASAASGGTAPALEKGETQKEDQREAAAVLASLAQA